MIWIPICTLLICLCLWAYVAIHFLTIKKKDNLKEVNIPFEEWSRELSSMYYPGYHFCKMSVRNTEYFLYVDGHQIKGHKLYWSSLNQSWILCSNSSFVSLDTRSRTEAKQKVLELIE